uniref:Colony stimulating factor 2 receptor subunit beta n=1 Tax=Falco tinnunculus TaxID=100819 RepID=A0A8C4TZ99_FALTI
DTLARIMCLAGAKVSLHCCSLVWALVIPMKSLSCYNDYNSQVTCTWMEHSEARALLFSSPLHIPVLTISSPGLCLHLSVQTLPPQNLSVSLTRSGGFLLTWRAADGIQGLGKALDYEVTYKREWESWEAASLLLSTTTRCHLSREDLVPGSSYVARVRARPGQGSGFSGQFSEWSTEVSWETPEGGIQPRNLFCLFNGADRLTCSWEVKKVITTSVLFGLFFRATPASVEEECSPVDEKALPHVPYVVQSCEIPVSNSSGLSQYYVSVRAKTEEKLIESYKNIKVLPPTNVSVTVTENGEYELRWIKHTLRYGFIKQRYEVEYWKSNQYDKVTLRNNDEPPFILTLQMLASSTAYRGKMRARVNTPLDYKGPWSEWSEEFAWETENGTFHAGSFCRVLRTKMWEEKIPNPSKSLLIQSYLGVRGSCTLMCSLFLFFRTSNDLKSSSCFLVHNEQISLFVYALFLVVVLTDVSPVTLDLQNSYHALNEPEHAPVVCPRQTAGHSFPVSRRNSADASIASQTAIPCFAFNGPYLYSPMMSSQPNMHQILEADPAGVCKKSVSLQYVTLPKEDCPQAPQRQKQPGEGAPQPFLLPQQKEKKPHLEDEKEASLAPPACGDSMNIRTEEQKSPKALSCIVSPQQCPLEYITTESLSPPSASDSGHLPFVTAGELPCDLQEPQPSSDHSGREFFPGQTGVVVPDSGQAPISSPELKQFLPEGNLVVLNPDSTEPVFLCQVGDYCFQSLKSDVKMDKDVSKMQAIQLFKNLKSDDYFSWQQSLRITEIC